MSSDPLLPASLPLAEPVVADGRVQLDATRLKALRKTLGLSQETLADACLNRHLCVSIASIKRAETGKPVLYRTARHLAAAFEVDIDTLLAQAPGPQAPDAPASEADLDAIRYVLALCLSAAIETREEAVQIIRQFGGVALEPRQGTMLAHFGTPLAHRSDSERGLLCALALCRAGLFKAGQAVYLRLMRLDDIEIVNGQSISDAPSAGSSVAVYVAGELVEQLGSRFEFQRPVDPHTLWHQCLHARTSEHNAPRELVGRAIEILQFKGVIEATLEYQDGHVVYLRGMAGIGKTRLTAEFVEMARQNGVTCHRGDVLDFGMDDVYWPLGQLVRSLLALPAAGALDSAALQAELARLHLSAEQGVFLQVLMGQFDTGERFALYAEMNNDVRDAGLLAALRELLLRVAVQQPLLLCLEDLHWGEPALFVLLGRLLEATNEAPVVWLLTSRHEDDPLDSVLRTHCSRPMSVLDIAALRPREALALAEQFTHVEPHYRADCVTRAQGNPLFLTQLLASQEGVFPDSLRHLVQSRFDRLMPEQRRALRYGSVFGNRFELALLRRVLGQSDYVPAPGMRHNLLREVEPGHYMFVHDLVMHCIYDALPASLREQLHQEVAAVYRDHDPVRYARHLLRADDPLAFDALLAAMQVKRQACQYENMLGLARQCEHFAERAVSSFTLAWLCGQACAGLGRMSEACAHYQQALHLADGPDEQIEAALELAPVLNLLERLDEKARLIERMMPVAQARQAFAAQARLLYLHGNLYFPRGDYLRCRQLHQQALQLAVQGDNRETRARALSGIGDSWYAQGHMQTAFEVFDQCVQLCEQHGLAQIDASNRSARASTQLYLGQTRQALSDAEAAIIGSQRLGNHRAEVFSRLTLGWGLLAMGRAAEAEPSLLLALEQARRLGARRFEALLLEALARAALQGQQRDQANALIGEAAHLVEQFHLQRYIGPWICASLALIVTDEARARQALAQGQTWLGLDCLAHNALRFQVTAAEVCLLVGDIPQAVRHAQALQTLADSAPCAWIGHHVGLIEFASGGPVDNAVARSRLSALQQQGQTLGLIATMPRLMSALSGPDTF
ncbi:hypothetical protein PS3A_43690 [Pseudomonas sp. 3A(2025)]